MNEEVYNAYLQTRKPGEEFDFWLENHATVAQVSAWYGTQQEESDSYHADLMSGKVTKDLNPSILDSVAVALGGQQEADKYVDVTSKGGTYRNPLSQGFDDALGGLKKTVIIVGAVAVGVVLLSVVLNAVFRR